MSDDTSAEDLRALYKLIRDIENAHGRMQEAFLAAEQRLRDMGCMLCKVWPGETWEDEPGEEDEPVVFQAVKEA